MKARRYYIIITWFPYNELLENRITMIDVEESMLERFISMLPLSDIAKIRVEENNND